MALRHWFYYTAAAVVFLSALPLTYGLADNLGTEFIAVFMRNEVEQPLNVPLELFITTPRTIPVQVRITTPGMTNPLVDIRTTVVSGLVEKVELSHLLRLFSGGIEGKVIYIHADNEVAVYGLNKEKFSTDGFLIYPVDVIGYEYYTVSHSPTDSYSVFALASKYDNAEVTITFPVRQSGNPIRVEHAGRAYTNSDTLSITLNAFQSFQCRAESQSDLTGTHIVSNLPLAAFSGNVRTWVGARTSRDHLAVQLPPVQAYGKSFPIVPFPGRTVGDIVRVVSSRPGTRIFVEGPPPRYFDLGPAGRYVDFEIPSDRNSRVSSEDPMLVVQIAQSQQSDDEQADPSMMIVTATTQYMSDYVFSTPQYYNGGSYDNWLMLTVDNDKISGLMFDNRPFAELRAEWTPLPGTILMGTQARIEDGAHTLRHVSPVAKFSGYLFGTADRESYSFQIGTRMALINQPCIPSESVFGDGVDNDCDGRIDEELCTGSNVDTDTDSDGQVDEDCAINRDIRAGAPDSGGRQFVIFFMENTVEAPQFLPMEVYVTPLRAISTSVQIESPRWFEPSIFQRSEVMFGNVHTFLIPYTMRETGTGMTSKALFITSNHDIAVYAVNNEVYSADAFLALPIDVLGKEYYTVTHYPNSDISRCQIGVIGVSDGTRVDITFPHLNRPPVHVEYEDVIYANGDMLSVVMDRYSTLQLQSRGDLTGTHIKSTQRVAVLSGNIRTAVGSGSSRDHLVAMLPPTVSWGKLYCSVPIPGRTTGDYFYVMAAENSTNVEVVSKTSFTLDAGDSRLLELSSVEYRAIRSDKPILVTQLSQSQRTQAEIGDPTMIVLPAVEQWSNAYTFSTTTNAQSSGDLSAYQDFMVMVCPRDSVEGLMFDGQFIHRLFTTWYTVSGTIYAGTSFLINQGVHTVQHVDPTVTFSVIVYGNADKKSYGFVAGMSLARINAPCDVTPTQRGDGIDNDCDGRIDEEMCDGDGSNTDTDGDGIINEDCAISVTLDNLPTESPITATPSTAQPPATNGGGGVVVPGPPGPAGPAGPPGSIGAPGAPGYNGFPGSDGLDGVDGIKGAKGNPGNNGEKGSIGATGNQGTMGRVGSTGATGIAGPRGSTGIQGSTGTKGDPGLSVPGVPGLDGQDGDNGATGVAGVTGATGVSGSKGNQGQAGQPGFPGVKGEQGVKGDMGPAYEDVNECARQDNLCSDGCVNTVGSFYCFCRAGFTLDQTEYDCVDFDECSVYNGGCVDTCVNTVGSFYCECRITGYALANDNRTCVDTNECIANNSLCSDSGACANTVGSFVCIPAGNAEANRGVPLAQTSAQIVIKVCSSGQELDVSSNQCIDVDECAAQNGGCTETCKNLIGSFYCMCSTGYRLAQDGRSCVDIDECSIDYNDCEVSETCINSVGTYHCLIPAVVETPDEVASVAFGSVDTSTLVSGNFLLGIFIWLVILTAMLLLLFICACKQCRDQEWEKKNHVSNLQDIYRTIQTSSNVPYQELLRNNSIEGGPI